MKVSPAYKIAYLLFVPIVGFVVGNTAVIISLLSLQLVLWIALKIPLSEFSQLRRVRRFGFFILLAFSFFYESADLVLLTFGDWELGFSAAGFLTGLIMISKLAIMLLAAQIVQYTTPPDQMLSGMRSLGMSSNAAEIMKALLELISTRAQSKKSRRGAKKGKSSGKHKIELKSLLKGDLSSVYALVDEQQKTIEARFSDNDAAKIASASALIVLVRFVKIAPGLPIAPGHKNALIVPFFISGSQSSQGSLTGAKIGFFSGMIHFMSGFGKYGPLGVLQFMLLGAVIDLLLKVFSNLESTAQCAAIGAFAGLFRVFSEILIAWILNVPIEFYLFYLPFILAHCLFGALSAPITKQLLSRNSLE